MVTRHDPDAAAFLQFVRTNVDTDRAYATLERFCRVGPPGADQLLGSPSLDRRTDLMREHLRAIGLDPHTHSFTAELHEPRSWSLRLLEPVESGDAEELRCLPIRYSAATPPGGLTAELVDLGPGFAEDYERVAAAGVDVRGKIVLLDNYTILAKSRLVLAALHGAAGAILVSSYEHDYHGFMAGGRFAPDRALRRGGPLADLQFPEAYRFYKFMPESLPAIPTLTLRRDTGKRLEGLLAGGATVRLRMAHQKDIRRVPARNLWAVILGATLPDEYIITGAHMDSYQQGARDDVSECVRLMETAELILRYQKETGAPPPARSLLFGFWTGEEASMIGSHAFLDEFRDLVAGGAVYFNGDGSAMAGGDRWVCGGSASLRALYERVSRRVLPEGTPIEWTAPIGAASDHAPFLFEGRLPVLQRLPGWWTPVTNYHDNLTDLVDTVDRETFRRPIEALALLLHYAANEPVVPFDFTHSAAFIRDEAAPLAGGAAALGLDLAPLLTATEEFEAAARSFHETVGRLGAAGGDDPSRAAFLALANRLAVDTVAPRLDGLSYDTDGVMPIALPALAGLRHPDRLPDERRHDLAA
ncbi:MAG: M28 family peptidase, partial [Chloroflexota bacterium]|nr:M28 family peptidase [Chloroflexota bacterium]